MHPLSEPAPHHPPLAAELAVRFVERESAGLTAALRTPCDSHMLHETLRWHDDAHRPWLALLASCDRAGWSSVASLYRLYGFHGRLAELLQRGCVGDEPARLLDAHLQQLTCQAVAELRADGHSRPDPEVRWQPPAGEDPASGYPLWHGEEDVTDRLGTVSRTATRRSPDAAQDGSPRA